MRPFYHLKWDKCIEEIPGLCRGVKRRALLQLDQRSAVGWRAKRQRSGSRVVGGGKGFGLWARWSGFSAYFAVARLSGEGYVQRRENGNDTRLENKTVWIDPIELDRDYLAQLDLIGEAEFEFRVWPADEPMPVEPTLTTEDPRPLPPGAVAVAYNDDLPGNNGRTRYMVVEWIWIRDSMIGADEIPPLKGPKFLRGDCNGDGGVNAADASCILNWLFAGGEAPGCVAATNANGDDDVNVTDPVSLLNFLFAGGPAPAAPFPDCGPDPTVDGLTCESVEACE